MEHGVGEWLAFLGLVAAALALDLGVLQRGEPVVRPRQALRWSALWIALGLAFGGLVWARSGSAAGLEYLTGYLVEKSLSIDNLFVFVVLFGALGIPPIHQRRVLAWGIVSALVLRGAMIAAGAALLHRFHWASTLLGAFLVLTGARLLFPGGGASHPRDGALFRMLRRVVPASEELDGSRFFTFRQGRRLATPLLLALLLVELTDVLFAVDSIPAVFAVTDDPFIALTSNVFAILGMRSLYFVVAGSLERFTYLKPSLAVVLLFVGAKMALAGVVRIGPAASLGVILAVLATGLAASASRGRPPRRSAAPTPAPPAP
jgi:tellurite resistance protein TerC